MPRHRPISRATRKTGARVTRRRQESRLRGFAAINQVRRGKAKSLSAAARAEGTTVRTIKRLLPAALVKRRRGRRIGVKASDPYSERVNGLDVFQKIAEIRFAGKAFQWSRNLRIPDKRSGETSASVVTLAKELIPTCASVPVLNLPHACRELTAMR